MVKRITFCLSLFMLALVACSRQGETGTTTSPAAEADTAVLTPTVTATPPATATATVTPEPTPIVPSISAQDQTLAEDGRLAIASVTSPGPGWLVIHAQFEDQVGQILGYTAVDSGQNEDVTVTIDPLQASPTLVAMLHVDAGTEGEYEFPGPDEPLQAQEGVVSSSFVVDIQAPLPTVEVANQAVEQDGLIRIDSALSPESGWLLIQADDNGAAGPVLGQRFLEAGLHEDVVVQITWRRQGTPRLHAVLYQDSGRSRRLDTPDEDLPFLVNGEPVMASFEVTYPPDVFVLDQPVIDGQVVVDRVLIDRPGWLVIYFDDGGDMGRIIGSAPLQEGVNERIVVDVVESAVTAQLHILLHEDTEPDDNFDFPSADPPLAYEGRMITPFTFSINVGNYLVTRDQHLNLIAGSTTATVTVPLAVTYGESWIVIRADDDEETGEPGQIVGTSWLPAGINRDVLVEVDAERATQTLYAVLHIDAGTPEQFDFPEGEDVALQRSRRIIRAPFRLLSQEEDE